jgi:hypothetical protein
VHPTIQPGEKLIVVGDRPSIAGGAHGLSVRPGKLLSAAACTARPGTRPITGSRRVRRALPLAGRLLFTAAMRLPWRAAAFCLAGTAVGCTGPTYDTAVPFTPVTPAVYVAKVKNLLVGLPPTDPEIAAVTASPDALQDLITGWIQLPQYQQKMMVFFQLAFQQTQITKTNFVDISPPNGLGNGAAVPLAVQNATESFARTVLADAMAGAPLNRSFTTTRLMMTPALMAVYAYLDAHATSNTNVLTDPLGKQKLTITIESTTPIALADTVTPGGASYLHFYNPDLPTTVYPDTVAACNGQTSITLAASSEQVWRAMFGEIPPHKVTLPDTTTVACPIRGATGAGQIFTDTDFTTWHPVTIRQPAPGEATTAFYDLPSLRTAPELVLNAPRPGFFSTPAFQANWPTNQSNMMRVTVNQALVIATGNAIDGTDATTPTATPGLDPSHAAPGSACFGCHQLLDPTRAVFDTTYTWFYNQQQDTSLVDQPSLFAFQNVVQPMQTIGDFANLLAAHPLVPEAWAQKLCYYASSAPCDPADPELQRIVQDFSSGLAWNTLVTELLASPIITNAGPSRTHDRNGEVIAVTRRDHLCAALNSRLTLDDVCQLGVNHGGATPTGLIMGGMPSDGYGRGATVPVLPNQPSLFYLAGAENICASVSALVIDPSAASARQQPHARTWSSKDAEPAISDFVATIIGVTSADPRAAQAHAILGAHFAAAMQDGATATDALRSTFVAACLSPSFIGIGM